MSAIDAFLLRIKRKNTLLLLIVKRRTVLTSSDNSKGAGRSLHYGLSAPPKASQAFVPGVAMETPHVL